MSAFGPWLLQQIKARGLTQAALADQVGVSQVQVSRWINGHDVPKTSNVFALAGYLNVSHRVILALLGTPHATPWEQNRRLIGRHGRR